MTEIVTLVPAYKPDHLAELFLGLARQGFRGFRVVLSDDSPDGRITRAIRGGAFDALIEGLDLTVVPGPRRGALRNVQHLVERFADAAPLVHLHLDDDVVYPGFYRAHAAAHAEDDLSATVSLRWLTTPDGRPAGTLPLPAFVEADPRRVMRVSTARLFESTVPVCDNWLGEFSNVVLRADAARRVLDASLAGVPYYGLGDIGLLLDAARERPLALIRDHLSGFRQHAAQNGAQTGSFAVQCGFLAWFALGVGAWRDGRIDAPQLMRALQVTATRCARQYPDEPRIAEFFALIGQPPFEVERIAADFVPWWARQLAASADARGAAAVAAAAAMVEG